MSELNCDVFCRLGDRSKDGYFIFKVREKQFTYINGSFANILELQVDEILASPGLIFKDIHPEDRLHAHSCYIECLDDDMEKKYELRLLKDDREQYIRIIVSPLKIAGETYLIGTVEETTVTRHNKIHIEQINARKNITLEVLAHDLKEPLGMMRLAASSLQESLARIGNEEMLSSLVFIKDMCERNLLLVRSMINHEFLKSTRVEIEKERTDLVWELRDVIRFYRRSNLGKTKNFVFTPSADTIYLHLDSMKFMQVINNLISNSIKFTAENGTISVRAEELKTSVLVSVSDDGIGIPDELQKGLFDRLPGTLRPGLNGEESEGFGMGIIKSIVDLHQGKIWFESEVGVGTTFYIELPK
ncbi:PAS domain-containing sensor histidine kinase [Pedobacter endophyticus]|uniref:histidine kinase n=1 Tax=Pedobacter endophyticus TaxID=2789740 RepID=A0A7S9L2Q1_9SPHI|nr:ATP-binding protein [Pedobacter endophyticus]QPH41382.1 ATPase [Pedobacter endophyticus]